MIPGKGSFDIMDSQGENHCSSYIIHNYFLWVYMTDQIFMWKYSQPKAPLIVNLVMRL